jgi:phosphoheptose isomerase
MSTLNDLEGPAPSAARVATRFPAAQHAEATTYFNAYAAEMARAAGSVPGTAIEQAAEILTDAYTYGACVFSCGNGGSASISNHLQCDHVKGVGNGTDLAPRVMSLAANIETITAIANDQGYEDIFVHQLRSQSRPGDVLVVVSSSGRSANIVRALTWARDNGLRTIALTGFDGGDAKVLAEVAIHVDCANYGVVEDLHQAIMHSLAQFIRQSRMTADDVSASVF